MRETRNWIKCISYLFLSSFFPLYFAPGIEWQKENNRHGVREREKESVKENTMKKRQNKNFVCVHPLLCPLSQFPSSLFLSRKHSFSVSIFSPKLLSLLFSPSPMNSLLSSPTGNTLTKYEFQMEQESKSTRDMREGEWGKWETNKKVQFHFVTHFVSLHQSSSSRAIFCQTISWRGKEEANRFQNWTRERTELVEEWQRRGRMRNLIIIRIDLKLQAVRIRSTQLSQEQRVEKMMEILNWRENETQFDLANEWKRKEKNFVHYTFRFIYFYSSLSFHPHFLCLSHSKFPHSLCSGYRKHSPNNSNIGFSGSTLPSLDEQWRGQ